MLQNSAFKVSTWYGKKEVTRIIVLVSVLFGFNLVMYWPLSYGRSVHYWANVSCPVGVTSQIGYQFDGGMVLRRSGDDNSTKIFLEDVFIGVTTTSQFHETRVKLILRTWYQLAKDETWFFTDSDDAALENQTRGHIINTHCPVTHNRSGLCCKTGAQFDAFLVSDRKWFCHFDDDNYVNIPVLLHHLGNYNSEEDWYLGRRHHLCEGTYYPDTKQAVPWYYYGTGGAGYCVSRSLAVKMVPDAFHGKFAEVCEYFHLNDDVTMGLLIEYKVGAKLTVVDEFHSEYDNLYHLPYKKLKHLISIGYSSSKPWNVIRIDGFDMKCDPYRFMSLHCHIFPNFWFCPRERN